MKIIPLLRVTLLFILIVPVIPLSGCARHAPVIEKIAGFPDEANVRLADFLTRTATYTGRKVAVFDGDGTTVGQVPHYLADECLYEFASVHPDRRPELIEEMKTQSNVSLPYVQNRIKFLAGETLDAIRAMGKDCYARMYADKIYPPMKQLIDLLKKNNFEVWIVSASPEALYQGFLSEGFDIPITRIIGVKSIVRDGVVTDEIIAPVPQDKGKMEAIESFIQEKPLLVGGNSRGDKEMIEFSRDLKLIINPDEHVELDQTMSVADYAKSQGWLVVRIRDVAESVHPTLSSKVYGIRLNKEHQ